MTPSSLRIAIVVTLLTLAAPLAGASGFVQRDGNKLTLGGREYRAIGVNIPHLLKAYVGSFAHNVQLYGGDEQAKEAMLLALDDAAASGFKFVRFFADPGYPKDIDKYYLSNPEAYWNSVKELVDACRARGLKVIPSLGSMPGFWADLHREPKQAILDPASKTHQSSYSYIREFVSRFKDDPTILMWELQNEVMHKADINQKGRPATNAALFTDKQQPNPEMTFEDSLTWEMILRLYREQTAFIKKIDPNHLVTSGDCHVRYESTSRRDTFPNFKFRDDTFEEWVANNIASQEPLDVISYHLAAVGEPKPRWGMIEREWMPILFEKSVASGKPVYLGEFGQDRPHIGQDRDAKPLREFIDIAENAGVSLIALWAWHFPWQPERTFTSSDAPALVEQCAAFNRKYAQP